MTCSEKFIQSVNLLAIKYEFYTKRNPWVVLCSHCPNSDSYSKFTYLAIMLLKPLGILQRVTKSQKVHHISNKKKTEIKN